MSAGRVVFFTGPTGAGKSTVADAWASSRESPTGYWDHDDARYLLRSGFVSRREVRLDESRRAEADHQWLLAARVCGAVAGQYVRFGIDFALAAFRPPGNWMDCWDAVDALDPVIVVLRPSIEVCLTRDAGRLGRLHTGEESIQRAFTYDWDPWRSDPRAMVIDNSDLGVQETIDLVETELKRRIDRLG